MVLLRQGADLRRRALVRLHDLGQRQGGSDQTPRQPRIRHGQSARRPHLRQHLLPCRRQIHERLGPDQQVGGAGLQVARMSLRRHLPQVPFARAVVRQAVAERRQQRRQQVPARSRRGSQGDHGQRALLARDGRREDRLPLAVHQRRAADAGGDLRPRIQQGTFGLPRNQLVLLFADLRYQDRHDQEVHEHLPHDQGHALHRHRRL